MLRGVRIYSDREELHAHRSWDETMKAIKSMDACFVTGHNAIHAGIAISKIKRLLLPDPTARSTIGYGHAMKDNTQEELIRKTTAAAKANNIKVRWLNEYCGYAFFVADRDELNPYVHIEFALPGQPIGHRPAITVSKKTHPKIFKTFVDTYDSLWDNHSREPDNGSR